MSDERLETYRGKRDFRRSPEPPGRGRAAAGRRPRFVIQKHDASTLHYDFRLETEGVLASWAVPRGPSTDPRDKRLAIRTEDHPLEYADFEGVIPGHEYGGGTVMVWDAGTYRNLADPEEDGEPPSIEAQIAAGHVTVWLEGEKLSGGYALIRTRAAADDESWLLVKMSDEGADARRNPTSTQPDSVKTGRTMDEIRADGGEALDS